MSESSGTYIVDKDFNIVNYNDTAKSLYPQLKLHEKCYKVLMGLDSPCAPCPIVNNVKGPRTYVDPIRNIQESVDAVEMPLSNGEVGHALIFSTVGANANIAATLPKTAEDLKSLSIVKALTTDYVDVFFIDIENMEMLSVRNNSSGFSIKLTSSAIDFSFLAEQYPGYQLHQEDIQRFISQTQFDSIVSQLSKHESFKIHYRLINDDQIHYFVMKLARIGDAENIKTFIVAFACEDEDMNERKRVEQLKQSLENIAIDSKTGLYTKEAFYVRANRCIEENPDKKYDLTLMKVANLAEINHQFGRKVGDNVLVALSNVLKNYTDKAIISYLGDGRFVSISDMITYDERIEQIKAFKEEFNRLLTVKNVILKWSLYKDIDNSISVEQAADYAKSALSMIRYESGREYIIYDQTISAKVKYNNLIDYSFEQAIESGWIRPYFQPKIDPITGEIVGAEALSRWIMPSGEMISPADFIPVIEKSRKIARLDQHIFKYVCRFQKYLQDNNLKQIPISVNLSRASMYRDTIGETYAGIAKSFGVDPKLIPIEITESIAVRAMSIREFSNTFIDNGFKLHMDDFGSGYSSFASLQIIEFEAIKLDKSLVDFIGKKSGESMLKHTIGYAKENGMKVVAEGVETKEQVEFLKKMECDYIQGFYYSKPLDEQTFIKRLKKTAS